MEVSGWIYASAALGVDFTSSLDVLQKKNFLPLTGLSSPAPSNLLLSAIEHHAIKTQ
jgi:hypothetical protein